MISNGLMIQQEQKANFLRIQGHRLTMITTNPDMSQIQDYLN